MICIKTLINGRDRMICGNAARSLFANMSGCGLNSARNGFIHQLGAIIGCFAALVKSYSPLVGKLQNSDVLPPIKYRIPTKGGHRTVSDRCVVSAGLRTALETVSPNSPAIAAQRRRRDSIRRARSRTVVAESMSACFRCRLASRNPRSRRRRTA